MSWIQRAFSKGDIDRAGRALIELPKDAPERDEAITIIDNWRSCHAYPLQVIKMTLLHRAKKVDRRALIAQRLKRRPSIEIKLRDNPHMKLSQMQDIGGCRAIVSSIGNVRRLVREYKEYHSKSPKGRSSWDGSDDFDYIKNPKSDGYRGVHLIFRFQSSSPERACFNGQRIEIQIRSELQHLWATAVETAQAYTGQALKSKIKNASEEWLRFFALTSSAFALREKAQIIPETPENQKVLLGELKDIIKREKIISTLSTWNDAIHVTEDEEMSDNHQYLLFLDLSKQTLGVAGFRKEASEIAQKAYETYEKQYEANPNAQVVLVSVDNLDALRKAYPNYYVDTKAFIAAVKREIA